MAENVDLFHVELDIMYVISVNLRTSSLIFCGVWTKLSRFMLVLGSKFLMASEISPVDDVGNP